MKRAGFPGMGRERSELSPGLRGFPIDNHLIYYRETDFGIDVFRILSGFRDIPPLFELELSSQIAVVEFCPIPCHFEP